MLASDWNMPYVGCVWQRCYCFYRRMMIDWKKGFETCSESFSGYSLRKVLHCRDDNYEINQYEKFFSVTTVFTMTISLTSASMYGLQVFRGERVEEEKKIPLCWYILVGMERERLKLHGNDDGLYFLISECPSSDWFDSAVTRMMVLLVHLSSRHLHALRI